MEDRASLYEICRNSLGTKKRMESWASWLISGKWKTGQTFSRMLMVRTLGPGEKRKGPSGFLASHITHIEWKYYYGFYINHLVKGFCLLHLRY
jgi:hypothetical protein